MKIKSTDNPPKKPSRKKSFDSFYIIAFLAIVVIILCFLLWQRNGFNLFSEDEDLTNRTIPEEISVPEQTPATKIITKQPDTPIKTPKTIEQEIVPLSGNGIVTTLPPPPDPTVANNSRPTSTEPTEKRIARADEVDPPLVQDKKESDYLSKICSQSTDIIQQFYNHLDTQDYMQKYDLEGTTEHHFTHLVQRLLNNPPVVSGETNDLYTILQNTAHFFRVIGKDNILILKGILDREKDQFENVLSNFYTLFQIPSCPENSFNIQVSDTTSLYEYAGFFLNTMGGRLYLFRRDSMSRMVVNYYSILLVEQANKEATNRHGIEIKAAVDQLILEMEANSNQLQMIQQYLDNLYTLKEKYQ